MQHKPVSAIDLHICWRCLPRLTLFWRALNKMERDVSASNLHFIFETGSSPIFLCWVFFFSAGNAMFDPSLLTRFGQFQVNFEFQVNFATGVLSCFPSLSLPLSLSRPLSLSLWPSVSRPLWAVSLVEETGACSGLGYSIDPLVHRRIKTRKVDGCNKLCENQSNQRQSANYPNYLVLI